MGDRFVPNPPMDSLSAEMKLYKQFYIALGKQDYVQMDNLIKNNQKLFVDFANSDLEIAKAYSAYALAGGGFDWSNGNMLYASDVFEIAWTIDKRHKKLFHKKAVTNIDSSGLELISLLFSSSKYWESGPSGVEAIEHKKGQAKRIQAILNQK